jgi:3',5'-cyclic-nucleotide phosphodiesterase
MGEFSFKHYIGSCDVLEKGAGKMKRMEPKFTWICLGVEGGLNESNLNCYLLAPYNSTDFICLDAGTLLSGLRYAVQKGVFNHIDVSPYPESTLEQIILFHHIKAYLITHCYLDHVHGLASISPNDIPKPVISLPVTIDDLRDSIFNWRAWPNMANEGTAPCIGTYHYVRLEEGERTPIENTAMTVTAFPLSHDLSSDSAAFLLESNGYYALYMGDTGPDEVEKRPTTEAVWEKIAPLIRRGQLRVIYMEASYRDEHSDDQLFGHLTPAWIMRAFHKLAGKVDPKNISQALTHLNVVIGHIKPDEYLTRGKPVRKIIKEQLHRQNDLGIRFILPEQGDLLEF